MESSENYYDKSAAHEETSNASSPEEQHLTGHDVVAAEALGGDIADMPKGYFTSPAFIGTFTGAALAGVAGYVCWTLPANTILLINADLDNSPNIIWVSLTWTLSLAIGFTLVGRMSDIFGRRYFFIVTSILALIGTIIAATAQTVNTLIGANVLIGLGASGGLSYPIIISELVPNKLRGPANGFMFIISMPIAVFGPVFARKFIENLEQKWRWNYYLGIILNVVVTLLYFFFYHPPTYNQLHVNGKTKRQQLLSFDWVGVFLLTAGIVCFLIGLNWGGGVYPWTSAHVLAPLLVGFAVLVAFGFWEAKGPVSTPLMPMRLFKNIKFDAIIACASVGAMVSYSTSIIWPTAISTLYTTDIQYAGWLACMTGGGLSVGQILGGFGLRYVPRMKIQMIVCSVILTAFVVALSDMNPSNKAQTLVFLFLGTTAAGYIETLAISSIALVWDDSDIGLANGTLGSIRTMAGSVVISMLSTILTNESAKNIPKYVGPAAVSAGLPETSLPALFKGLAAGSLTDVPGISTDIAGAAALATQVAFSKTFKVAYLSVLPFGVVLIAASFLTPNMESYLTDRVPRKLQGKSAHNAAPVVDEEK